MEKFAAFLSLLVTITFIVVGVVIFQRLDTTIEAQRLAAEARKAEAETARLQAQLDLAQAQAQIETAAGERAVLEAAARSVDADRRLVTWYTLRGDLRGVLALVGAVGLAICGGALYVILKRVNNESKNTDQK